MLSCDAYAGHEGGKGRRGQFPGLKPPEVRFVTVGHKAPRFHPRDLPGFIGGAEFFELADYLTQGESSHRVVLARDEQEVR